MAQEHATNEPHLLIKAKNRRCIIIYNYYFFGLFLSLMEIFIAYLQLGLR